jgi:hypothetical protein
VNAETKNDESPLAAKSFVAQKCQMKNKRRMLYSAD